jgi:hypothetical protein
VDIVPSKGKKINIPDSFPLADGKVSCATCHDMYIQCQDNTRYKIINKRFLRGAPYVSRTSLCFKCHDETKFKRLDPHNQLTADGKIIEDKCLYCHVDKPDQDSATFDEVKLIGDLKVLCFRCHFKQSQFHPINANHLLKPNEKILSNLKNSEATFGVVLPLDYEGKITCSTCHNPHEKGVIPGDRASSKGASEKYRLRLAQENLIICAACHKDKIQGLQ